MFRTNKGGRHRWANAAKRNAYAVVFSPRQQAFMRVYYLADDWWSVDYV